MSLRVNPSLVILMENFQFLYQDLGVMISTLLLCTE